MSTVDPRPGPGGAHAPMAHPPGSDAVSLSGLNEGEARGFHRMFVISFLGFLAIAIVAHVLVWQWRPWIPGTPGYPAVNAAAPAAR